MMSYETTARIVLILSWTAPLALVIGAVMLALRQLDGWGWCLTVACFIPRATLTVSQPDARTDDGPT